MFNLTIYDVSAAQNSLKQKIKIFSALKLGMFNIKTSEYDQENETTTDYRPTHGTASRTQT